MLFDLEVSTGGMEDLIFTVLEGILELNLADMDLDYLGNLLTFLSPVWNTTVVPFLMYLLEAIGMA